MYKNVPLLFVMTMYSLRKGDYRGFSLYVEVKGVWLEYESSTATEKLLNFSRREIFLELLRGKLEVKKINHPSSYLKRKYTKNDNSDYSFFL